ncbi:flagellar filament capping protein FliD [Sporomusa sp. KB1]|jgi:flagellar hook-associated protein 2|uniref:flagellar filament capping protein FliD n=1 Tax=Sporomusa sp. KB1 TaxID=943346 RepID=UPI0011A22E97|nr:flagellar filament capping protein FliD [Sporomusa sp. KB1]TWH47385.1 flagellar hook-associated protein 2 [Sporomusa sp. KB1]
MSSSSSITTSTVNGVTRITGLASGIDVDGIVESLVAAEKEKKLNKLQQKLQTAEWKQEAYQSVITDLTDFADTYLSTTGSSSIMKASNYLQYDATSSDDAVTVSAATTASAGSHTVSVSQLATEATCSSSASISKEVQGSAAADYSSLTDESFVITLDGTDYTVDLDSVTDLDSLQDAIDDAVGSTTKVTVSTNSSGYLEITAQDDSGVQAISISAVDDDDGLSELFGTDPILSNRLSTSSKLSVISDQLNTALTFDSDGECQITINGTTLTLDEDDTLAEVISAVAAADVGATLAYNSLTGELTLTADDTGAGNTLTVADCTSTDSTTGTDFTSNFVSTLLTVQTDGTDAIITIDGVKMTRSTNSVTVDGVTYTANALTTTSTTDSSTGITTTTDDPLTVTVTQDSDGVYDLISNFVDAYNELIETINALIDEDADSDYPPLTDDEKEEMTDDEITAWEAKAKVGLLESDSTLKDLLSDLRTALYDSVSGASTTLADLGITTSSDYSDQGTLEIDEDTLTAAITSDPEAIMNLFTQKATSKATTSSVSGKSLGNNSILYSINSTDLETRYEEEGIAYRFFDILEQNISTKTFSSGNEGALLEIAGIDGDTSETDNTLTTLIEKYEDEISDEEDRIDDYEDTMYDKYTTLETYISTMNSQLSALSSLTSSS